MFADDIKTLLLNNEQTAALLDTRIYASVLPRTYKFPVACFHQYGQSALYSFEGLAPLTETYFQFDCYGSTATSAREVAEAIKAVLGGYTGTLSSGTVQCCYLERDMDMPFVPDADVKGISFHTVLQFRFVHS